MTITLTPNAEQIVRDQLARHPEQSPEEVVEQALRSIQSQPISLSPRRTREDFRVWLKEYTKLSDQIPNLPGETFSREMIYEDQD